MRFHGIFREDAFFTEEAGKAEIFFCGSLQPMCAKCCPVLSGV